MSKGQKKRMATITREWIAQNLEQYRQLLDRKPECCPVCYESLALKNATSPLLSDMPSPCTHWLCTECWKSVAQNSAECPICKEDLRTWLLQTFTEKPINDEVQKFLISVMMIRGGGQPIIDDAAMFDISHKLFHYTFS